MFQQRCAPMLSGWQCWDFPSARNHASIAPDPEQFVGLQVYQGTCKTNLEKVAIKKLDLDNIGWGAHWVCCCSPSFYM